MTKLSVDRRRFRDRGQHGTVIVMFAILLTLLFTGAAFAVDLSTHSRTRQDLWDTLDAAAHAGAWHLPHDAIAADAEALAFANVNDAGLVPDATFWCVVGSVPPGVPNSLHIPTTCDPGPPPYTSGSYPGMGCDDVICAIPCDPNAPQLDSCNTIQVADEKDVPYKFAPVIGIDEGYTGTLRSAACKGICGGEPTGPLDLVVTMDRTGSMNQSDVDALKNATQVMLESLRPDLQHVALATIGRSSASPPLNCPSVASGNANGGPWVPVGLSDDYDLTDNDPPDDPPSLNNSSDLVRAVQCLDRSSTGTNLGDSLAGAANHLGAAGRAEATQAVLFMTDGEANQPASGDPCNHALSSAQNAKASGVVVITVAYRLEGVLCGPTIATELLADMASDPPDGPASADDGGDGPLGLAGGCANPAAIAAENADRDYFFCTPNQSDLAPIFVSATQLLNEGIKLVRLPV